MNDNGSGSDGHIGIDLHIGQDTASRSQQAAIVDSHGSRQMSSRTDTDKVSNHAVVIE